MVLHGMVLHGWSKMQRLISNNSPGELYVIQTRHCVHTRMPVYKVGRSIDAGRRLRQYPKGSLMMARLPVCRMKDSETVLLELCRARFNQRKDFGTEYFESDLIELVGLLAMVAAMFPRICGPPVIVIMND